jgi:hypothetical protein
VLEVLVIFTRNGNARQNPVGLSASTLQQSSQSITAVFLRPQVNQTVLASKDFPVDHAPDFLRKLVIQKKELPRWGKLQLSYDLRITGVSLATPPRITSISNYSC